jgi:hypothetical protein
MPKLSMLPTILAAAFAFAAGPAQAEMKSQWVEYSHGDTKLKAYMAWSRNEPWKRLHRNVLASALANRLARIAWSVLAHGRAGWSRRVLQTFKPL